ncbi:MAG: TetR/AcrR family transcriptional regulator [Rubrobacter sp.]|nr:TetR/AcrR family transcriptional regulator [Rubrobacter sp.]
MSEERDRRSGILSAAFEEFASKGFKGATIKSIAEAAGVPSPALIYWYFPDKEALFREVVESRMTEAPFLRVVSDPESFMALPPEEALKTLGRAYFGFERFDRRVMELFLGEVIRRPEMREAFVKFGPARALAFIEEYLGRQIEAGNLRPHDTRSSSRAFMGMLFPQLAGRMFFPALMEGGPTDEEHLDNIVDIFLKGLEA